MSSDYKTDLETANVELRELLSEREDLEIRIAKQRARIAALMSLIQADDEIDQVVGVTLGGLTEACRTVLRSVAFDALTPVQVRDKLAQLGFPVAFYKNVMAAIHTVLKRLEEARDVVSHETKDGVAYGWNPVHKLAKGARFSSRFHPDKQRYKSRFQK